MIITIDGPAGSGKSTVARLLAKELNIRYLDTGAMYRAVALALVQAGIDENDADTVAKVAAELDMQICDGRVLLNGTDVTDQLRRPEVDAAASVVAANPAVRQRLVELQRQIAEQGSLVTEGRDQGTVVFPQADFKFFLTASLDARARRRHRELVAKGSQLTLATVRRQLEKRDERDENRQHAPMKPAPDAHIIDTSDLSIAQVVELLKNIVQQQQHSAPQPKQP